MADLQFFPVLFVLFFFLMVRFVILPLFIPVRPTLSSLIKHFIQINTVTEVQLDFTNIHYFVLTLMEIHQNLIEQFGCLSRSRQLQLSLFFNRSILLLSQSHFVPRPTLDSILKVWEDSRPAPLDYTPVQNLEFTLKQ